MEALSANNDPKVHLKRNTHYSPVGWYRLLRSENPPQEPSEMFYEYSHSDEKPETGDGWKPLYGEFAIEDLRSQLEASKTRIRQAENAEWTLIFNPPDADLNAVTPEERSVLLYHLAKMRGSQQGEGDKLAASEARVAELEEALESAIKVADEATTEWDAAPAGMRAGKLLNALSRRALHYRADIDAIHAARRK